MGCLCTALTLPTLALRGAGGSSSAGLTIRAQLRPQQRGAPPTVLSNTWEALSACTGAHQPRGSGGAGVDDASMQHECVSTSPLVLSIAVPAATVELTRALLAALAQLADGLLLLSPMPSPAVCLAQATQLAVLVECDELACHICVPTVASSSPVGMPVEWAAPPSSPPAATFHLEAQSLRGMACTGLCGVQGASCATFSVQGLRLQSGSDDAACLLYRAAGAHTSAPALVVLHVSRCTHERWAHHQVLNWR